MNHRDDRILRMREDGLTFREIGERCRVTTERARQVYHQARRIAETRYIPYAERPYAVAVLEAISQIRDP